jgi:hypothetical protein
MPAPILWKNKLLLAKTEGTYGTDPTPTGGADAILATNVRLSPMEGDDVSRDLDRPYLGAQAMIPVGLRCRLQFNIELVPSGTAGTAPAWGPIMKALGCSETIVASTSVTYRPVSTAHSSVTFWIWHGLTKQIITGARGTARLRFTAQGLPYLECDFIGLYNAPAEAAQLSPTYTGFKKPLPVTKTNTPTFTVNAVAFVMRETILDLGNQVEPRLLVGSEQIIIVDRAESLSMRVEAQPVSSFNPFSLAAAQTEVAVSLVHGTVAGAITTLAAPTTQIKRLSGFENAQNILEWPLEGVPLPSSGNDQWSLALT